MPCCDGLGRRGLRPATAATPKACPVEDELFAKAELGAEVEAAVGQPPLVCKAICSHVPSCLHLGHHTE